MSANRRCSTGWSARRQALVDDQPGVTRDRREAIGKLGDLTFTLVDTAGLEEAAPQSLAGRMLKQTKTAIAEADAILFVFDSRAGLLPADQAFAELVRRSGKAAILVANKSEGKAGAAGALEAYELGFGTPIPLSAEHGEGLSDLYDALQSILDPLQSSDRTDDDEPNRRRARSGSRWSAARMPASRRWSTACSARSACSPDPRPASPATPYLCL